MIGGLRQWNDIIGHVSTAHAHNSKLAPGPMYLAIGGTYVLTVKKLMSLSILPHVKTIQSMAIISTGINREPQLPRPRMALRPRF